MPRIHPRAQRKIDLRLFLKSVLRDIQESRRERIIRLSEGRSHKVRIRRVAKLTSEQQYIRHPEQFA